MFDLEISEDKYPLVAFALCMCASANTQVKEQAWIVHYV